MVESSFYKQDTLPGFAAPKEEETHLPEAIGPYKIESLLNKGGMSLLYLGVDPKTKEPRAIKTLLPKFVDHPEAAPRFLKEATEEGAVLSAEDLARMIYEYNTIRRERDEKARTSS